MSGGRNGSGVYSLPEAPFVPNTVISSAAVNDNFSNIAAALTDSIAADGQTPITGALLGASGTKTAPGWAFASDTSSGLYLLAAGKPGLVAAGFGMLVDSAALKVTAATPSAAGSGYAVGDTVTLSGGTGVLNAILTVATLSGSGVATVTVLIGGNYSVAPTNPAAQGSTSGSGTGATFTLTTGATAQFSDLAGASLWQDFGATPYMAGAMGQGSALALANYIGASNLAAAILTSLPVPMPQGYLTPISGQPVIASNSVSATAIYYTPYQGTWNPIHNGTAIVPIELAGELALTLTSSQGASGIFDIYLAYNSGTPVIGTGPGWNAGGSGGNVTAGSCARSTGAGGAALARFQGFLTNAASMSLIYNTGGGNTTITVPANQGFYLGSIATDGSAGQVSNYIGWNAVAINKRGLWNFYNRQPLVLEGTDNTSSWTYNTNTIRQSRASASNFVQPLCGWNDEFIYTSFQQYIGGQNANGGIGIGWNSTTAFSGTTGNINAGNSSTIANASVRAEYDAPPSLGINRVNALEVILGTSVITFTGGQTTSGPNPSTLIGMQLRAQWRG
jgi:hypothetical protein